MTQYARVSGGVVLELVTVPAGLTIGQMFHADVAAQFVAVPAGISPAQGWSYSGGSFAAPAPAAPTLAGQAAVAMSGGITLTLIGSLALAATEFPTDPVSTGKLGAVVTAIAATGGFPGGAASFPMKDSAGAWHVLTAAQYKSVAGAIAAYVAALDLIVDGNPLGAVALPAATATVAV